MAPIVRAVELQEELQATDPVETEPEETEPEATEPEVTEPEETEPEATEPEVTEPEETEPEATEPEATEPEETEPEATEPEESQPVGDQVVFLTETAQDTDENGILLCWNLDSTLVYSLNESNFTWKLYDADGKEITGAAGTPAFAEYVQTSQGTWYGSATARLTITNTLDQTVQLRLLFMNALSGSAAAISSTLETESDDVDYDANTGLLVIQPGAEGVITMTISAEVLNTAQIAVDSDNTIPGWIQAQVISPVDPPEDTAQEQNVG